jgi:hypothetical protein
MISEVQKQALLLQGWWWEQQTEAAWHLAVGPPSLDKLCSGTHLAPVRGCAGPARLAFPAAIWPGPCRAHSPSIPAPAVTQRSNKSQTLVRNDQTLVKQKSTCAARNMQPFGQVPAAHIVLPFKHLRSNIGQMEVKLWSTMVKQKLRCSSKEHAATWPCPCRAHSPSTPAPVVKQRSNTGQTMVQR